MITVPEATKKIIERSRYLTEAISKGLINYSSLARYIKPELEEMLLKPVSEAAVLMALRRLEHTLEPKFTPVSIFTTPPDMVVRSNLFEVTLTNSPTLSGRFKELYLTHKRQESSFFTFTEGLVETTMIASTDLQEQFKTILTNETTLSTIEKLSSITIRLPKESLAASGIYYFFLKSLAWEGISITEIVSTYRELTIILEEKEIHRAFAVLSSLFS